MKNKEALYAGLSRLHSRSLIQKGTFALGHLIIIIFCFWIVYGNGWESLGRTFGKDWQLVDYFRAQIMLACVFVYWVRHILTLFYLLSRTVELPEVLGLLFFFSLFEIGLLLLGGGAFRNQSINPGLLDLAALVLYLVGSYLNSFSEIQRKWWKADPNNKGHIYTQGLFGYSMHINYFGDTILFSGWCLFTYNYWTLGLPLLMVFLFVFFHIPGLDSYLAERYGVEFQAYSEKTKKFIPFIF